MTLVLVPPSEGKASGGSGRWRPGSGRFRSLAGTRAAVAEALGAAMADEALAAKVTKLTPARLAPARATNTTVVGAPVLPAWQRYGGVVWQHLDPATLDARARARAEASVAVVSALGGLFGFADPVPDYKCGFSAPLPGGRPAQRWAAEVTDVVRRAARRGPVFDLLPLEFAAAVDRPSLPAGRLVEVAFRSGDGRAAGHAAKAAKGRFLRHLLDAGEPDVWLDAATTFSWDGWQGRVERPDLVVVASG